MVQCDVLVVGGVGVDTIVSVPRLPLAVVDSLIVPPVRDYVGHTGNGMALGCKALGLRTRFIDFIGDDPQGRLVLERYAREGLDFHHIVHESGTRRSVNLVDRAGNRMSLYDPRHPLDLRMPRDFYLPHLEQCRHAHFSIMNWVRELYDDAVRLGLPVSTDLHDWDGENTYHRDFAWRSDMVFMSAAAVGDRFAEVMRHILEHGRVLFVAVTAGKRGSFLLARGGDLIHLPAVDLGRPVVDTNGAGDSFAAAFLYGRLAGMPLPDCLLLGNIAGAYACGCRGTHEEFIGTEELLRQFDWLRRPVVSGSGA